MAGTGNLLLKRGTNMPYDITQDNVVNNNNSKVLLKGMPASQIVGLSPYYKTWSGFDKYVGTSTLDVPNRLWVGTDGFASSDPESGQGGVNESDTYAPLPTTGNITTNNTIGYTRPLWMGAEIRASEAVKDNNGTSGEFVILKANWDKPSDYVLVTQKAIAKMPIRVYENTADGGGGNIYKEYVEFGGYGSTEGFITYSTKLFFPDYSSALGPGVGTLLAVSSQAAGTNNGPNKVFLNWVLPGAALQSFLQTPEALDIALLGSSGQTKGPQTFQSQVVIEQALEVNGYTDNSVTYGARITSQTEDAYIFNENVLDLSIGGSASVISIGNPSSDSCTVTVYDELVVTGNLQANSIDGGSF